MLEPHEAGVYFRSAPIIEMKHFLNLMLWLSLALTGKDFTLNDSLRTDVCQK